MVIGNTSYKINHEQALVKRSQKIVINTDLSDLCHIATCSICSQEYMLYK